MKLLSLLFAAVLLVGCSSSNEKKKDDSELDPEKRAAEMREIMGIIAREERRGAKNIYERSLHPGR